TGLRQNHHHAGLRRSGDGESGAVGLSGTERIGKSEPIRKIDLGNRQRMPRNDRTPRHRNDARSIVGNACQFALNKAGVIPTDE
ncbi:MAG: hypothetical protein QF437_34390, partial [Planctomycetota bacterium]|nr:hypothetical protein [Planctomycetota bacterium]